MSFEIIGGGYGYDECDENSNKPKTPVAKAFFDTVAGRGLAVLGTFAGFLGSIESVINGDVQRAAIFAAAIPAAAQVAFGGSKALRPAAAFILSSIGAGACFCVISSASARESKAEINRVQALPIIAPSTHVSIPVKSLVCQDKTSGWEEATTAKHGISGRVNCAP